MSPEPIQLFYIRSAFEYFFSLALIEHLGLGNVTFILNEPREGIEERIAGRFPLVYTKDGFWRRLFGKKMGKLRLIRQVFSELDLRGKHVELYSPVFNETCIFGLRDRMDRECADVGCFLIPDGAALLRHLPRKPEKPSALIKWVQSRYRVEPADRRHTSGSYSDFIRKVYHYPAKQIYADPEKIEIVPVPTSDKEHTGKVLVVGGLRGISREFVLEAKRLAVEDAVRYRMHPRNRSGEEFIREEGPDWEELSIEGSLEEHLLDEPYRLVVGPYSTSLMFNHLFVPASASCFLIDAMNEDEDWQATAEACSIPIHFLTPEGAPEG